MTLAARPLAPLAEVHAAVAEYVDDWARSAGPDRSKGHNLATWRAHHATFTRLPEGDWGVAVPLYLEQVPAEIDGETHSYLVEVQRRDGTLVADVRVRPIFTLERGEYGIEICEIAERERDTRDRARRRRRRRPVAHG